MPMRRVNSLISVASYGKKSFKTGKLQRTPEKTKTSLNDEASLQSRNDDIPSSNNNDYNNNNNNSTTLAIRKHTILDTFNRVSDSVVAGGVRGSMMVRSRSRSSLMRKSRSMTHLSSLQEQQQKQKQQQSSSSANNGGGSGTTTTTHSSSDGDDDNVGLSSSSSTGNNEQQQQQSRRQGLEHRDPQQSSNRSIGSKHSQSSNDYGHFLTEDGSRVKTQTNNNNNNTLNNNYGLPPTFFTTYAGEELEETMTRQQQHKPFQKSSSFLELSSLKSTTTSTSPAKRTTTNGSTNATHRHVDTTLTTPPPHHNPSSPVLILLLHPHLPSHEIVSLPSIPPSILVRDLLHLIPPHAIHDDFAAMEYVGLCRDDDEGGRELINSFRLEVHDVARDELLIAIPRGCGGEEVVGMARSLGRDDGFRRVLEQHKSRGRRSRRRRGVPSDDDDAAIESKTATTTKDESDATSTVVSSREKRHQSSSPPFAPSHHYPTALLVLLTLLAVVSTHYHHLLTQPLKPGDTLHVGEWRSHCGLLDFFPLMTNCRPMILEMVSDRRVVVYEGGMGRLLWDKMTTSHRRRRELLYEVTSPSATNDRRRRRRDDGGGGGGVRVESDGTVTMGDEEAFVEFSKGDDGVEEMATIQPWPFVAIPTKWRRRGGGFAKLFHRR